MRNFFSGFLLAFALFGCADYQFTVNDRVVYTPAQLFVDYDIGDAALLNCVKQHIVDASITAAEHMTSLNCSHAGVAKLDGLEVFVGLTQLKLSNNDISNLAALAGMAQLQTIYLDGNDLRSIMPLRGLSQLRTLNLQGNPALTCMQLAHFASLPDLELEAPVHCSD